MGLFQRAYETYCAMEDKYAGKHLEDRKEPLAPVGHLIKKVKYEIALGADGEFRQASAGGKNEELTVVPSTEASAGRSGTTAYTMTFPLCEAVKHITAEDNYYIPQLEKWVKSEYCHPTAEAVLKYVKKGTVAADLARCGLIESADRGTVSKDDGFVRWRVLHDDPSATAECWKDPSLFRAFIKFYESERGEEPTLCMVTGDKMPPAKQHAKGIVPLNGNAKLISANDSSGFTYRGRFRDDSEAVTVSYEASQKAHNALRWLIVNQGEIYGGRTFLCWNPEGKAVRSPQNSFLRAGGKTYHIASDYQDALNSELLGLRAKLPDNADIVLAAFDAATTGRLALTAYSELPASDFLQRLRDWENTCCWFNGKFGIQSPSLLTLVNCTYGTQREQKGKAMFVTDDRVLAQQMQRLISCKVNGGAMPRDIVMTLVNRASMPQAYEPNLWRNLLYTACAAIQKYYTPKMRGEFIMEWSFDRPDRSFQFGRLLAVMERAENDYYRSSGDERMTNAIKAMSQYRQTPWTVFERVNSMLETAYLPRCEKWARDRYHRLCGEIVGILSTWDKAELNKPLNEFYLMGYTLQRNAFFRREGQAEQTEQKETEE